MPCPIFAATRRQLVLGVFVLTASLASAHADVLYEQRVLSTGLGGASTEGLQTVHLQADRERSQISIQGAPGSGTGEMLSITRLDRELIWYLDVQAKTYVETTFGELRARFNKSRAAGDTTAAARAVAESEVKVERTGKKDTICGAEAKQVILTIESKLTDPAFRGGKQYLVADLWMAKNFPGSAELEAYNKATAKAMGVTRLGAEAGPDNPLGHLLARLGTEMEQLEGTAIRSTMTFELDVPAGTTAIPSPVPAHGEGRQVLYSIRSEMTRIESKALTADLFELPSGYTKNEPR